MASPDRPNSEAKLQIGEMPKPRYMREAPSTVRDGMTKWIGMEAYAPDGEIKEFHWWRNYKAGDFTDEKNRYHTAAFIARLKLEMDVDAAIGMPVDLHGSNSDTGVVQTVDEPEVFGVYIESDKRPMFNFLTMMRGVREEAELRSERPVEFDAAFQAAKAVLPKPEAKPGK